MPKKRIFYSENRKKFKSYCRGMFLLDIFIITILVRVRSDVFLVVVQRLGLIDGRWMGGVSLGVISKSGRGRVTFAWLFWHSLRRAWTSGALCSTRASWHSRLMLFLLSLRGLFRFLKLKLFLSSDTSNTVENMSRRFEDILT